MFSKTDQLAKLFGMAEKSSSQFINVSVKIIEISWLNKNLRKLLPFFAGISDDNIFDTELVKVLLTQ
jgi:hypothetical protein